jgi:HEAT repeat protein
MKMRFSRLFFVAICFVLSAVAGVAQPSGGTANIKQIKEAIARVRSEKTVDARTVAAEHLASLMGQISSKEVTVALVTDITSLLDSPDDSVRYWVATALGNLGPAAKSAAPKLEEMLPKAACLSGVITSASGIRYALIRMGFKLPPPPKCDPVPIAG